MISLKLAVASTIRVTEYLLLDASALPPKQLFRLHTSDILLT
jgi:hypothetical protein